MKWLLLLLLSTSLHAENLTVRIESPDEDSEHYTLQSFQTEDLSTCKGMMRNISSKLEDGATAVMTCSNTETLTLSFMFSVKNVDVMSWYRKVHTRKMVGCLGRTETDQHWNTGSKSNRMKGGDL
jgi:hypothetical protein